MKRPAVVLAITAMLAALLSGCGGSGGSSTIKIGEMVVLSGSGAAWGQAELNGAKMAMDSINASGGVLGKKLELVHYDNKGTAAEGVTAMKKIIEQDKVVAFVGGNLSDVCIAVAPIYTAAKVPMVATMPANTLVTLDKDGSLRQFAFRLVFADKEQGKILAEFARKELKAETAGILFQSGLDYSVGIADTFQEMFTQLGGQVVEKVAFQTGDVDFRPQLTKIKEKSPDVLLIPMRYKESALAAVQAKELGIQAKLIGSDGWNSPVLVEMGKQAVEGAFTIAHLSIDDPSVADFRADYKKRYNIEPEVNAVYAYDAVGVIADAIKRAGKADSSAIRDALEKTDKYKGLIGDISFNPKTHNISGKPALILKIQDGKFVPSLKFTPQD